MNKGFISLGFPLEWNELIFMKRSKKIFYKVDFELNNGFSSKIKKNGCHTLAVVSAVGANKSSNNYYLSIKGQLEEEL